MTYLQRILDRIRYLHWLHTEYVPISGGAPDDDEDDSDDDSSDDEDTEDETSDDEDDSTDDEDEDDDEDLSKADKAELHRLRRQTAERAEKDRKAKRKADEESGKWEQVVKDTEAERDSEKDRADKAEAALAKYERNTKVTAVAKRLKFRDPEDAHRFLPDDAADGSEAQIEKRLKQVVKDKDYLIDKGSPRKGKATGGGSDTDGDQPEIGDMDDPKAIREAAAKLRA